MRSILEQKITTYIPAYQWSGKEEDMPDLINWMKMYTNPNHLYVNKVKETKEDIEPCDNFCDSNNQSLKITYNYYDSEWECTSQDHIIVNSNDWIIVDGEKTFRVIENLEDEGFSIVHEEET